MQMTLEEGVQFFADLFGGRHHILGSDYAEKNLKKCGQGWSVVCSHDFATYDMSLLTKLVFLAHDRACRASVDPAGRSLRISIWKRARSGNQSDYHPTLDEAIKRHRQQFAEETIR